MKYYVDQSISRDGIGTKEAPFKTISAAAKIAMPGDEVLVAPGIYRENVNPIHPGTKDARIAYRSTTPLAAVITGAEPVTNWTKLDTNQSSTVWYARIPNSTFGKYNPYTTLVYGDWYFATPDKHTGCVWLNNMALYEATSLQECIEGAPSETSWAPENSIYKWYTEQDSVTDETIIYANFQDKNPNEEHVEINVRRECFFPQEEGVDYITVDGFTICQAATTWAPPAAFQDGMIGPHWSKGWIIENCEIWGSKCAGISLGKYLDPEQDHYFTYKQIKSPTQMERDAVCRGQYHGWLKEKIGSHLIRHNNIHHCEQGGIIGRMGGVFSIIEDNHIHHINNMMELGGAEIAGIKMHAAIDVIMRRNHIHHCTMGIWCDWEAQGTRLTQNLLHDNQRPIYAKQLKGGMMSQDIFVEVGHGPTLIDNNVLLSDVSLRFATESVALVHNLICGAFTIVGGGTGPRYTPYHIAHRTEVMGFMTILHGDDRIYNNIFVQKWPSEDLKIIHDSDDGFDLENRKVGTYAFDEYPTYDEWISQFDFTKWPDMGKLYHIHEEDHLPVWIEGNAYLAGATNCKKEINAFVDAESEVKVDLVCDNMGACIEMFGETNDTSIQAYHSKYFDSQYHLDTNIYELIGDFSGRIIDTNVLGKAHQPEELFENPDGTPITFDRDYFGSKRNIRTIPGPFAERSAASRTLI